jgi:hypothetical protein
MSTFRFTGTIAKGASIRRCKSYRGRPSSRQEELELDERDHTALSAGLNGRPLCYNHDDDIVVGSVLGNTRRPNGDWDIHAEIGPMDQPRNRELAEWVKGGLLQGLSLKHYQSSNEPIEVSLCFKGARPGTTITKVMQYDSKSQLYNLTGDAGDDIVPASAVDDNADAELLLIVAASVTAMSTTTEPAAAPAAPAAASAPPATAPPPTPAAPSAPLHDEMKDAEAAFVETSKVNTILSNVHGIPSKAQREELAGIASRLELEKLELSERNKAMEEQIAKHASELESVRKEAESKAKSLYEAEQQINTQRHLAGDLIKTLGEGKDDKEVDAVLASMGPAATKFFAERGREFVAASQQAGGGGGGGAAMEVDVVESEVQRNMLRWLAMKNKKKSGTLVTPTARESKEEEEGGDDETAASQPAMSSYGSGYRNLFPTPPHQQAPAGVVVKASSSSNAKASSVPWGKPIEQRPRDGNGRIVSASYNGSRQHYLPETEESFEPGAGPNFLWGWMQNEGQIEVFMDTPSAENAGNKFNIVQAGYSSEFIDTHRRLVQASSGARKQHNAVAVREAAERARMLRTSSLPSY